MDKSALHESLEPKAIKAGLEEVRALIEKSTEGNGRGLRRVSLYYDAKDEQYRVFYVEREDGTWFNVVAETNGQWQ